MAQRAVVERAPASRPARFDVRLWTIYVVGVLKFWIAAWCLCVAVAPAAAQPADGILVNADIIAMSEAGLRSELIVSLIKTRYSAFDVDVDDLVRLGAAGDDDVIAAIVAAEYTVDASPPVELETERRRPARTRRRAPAADRDEALGDGDDEPGAFVYVGFRYGFVPGNRVLRRVEGDYHSWVTVADIDLARRFGNDEHLRRPYRALEVAAGPTNGGFEGLWLPGRDAERFGLAWSIDSLWVRHVTDDDFLDHVPNPIGFEYTAGAAGAAAVYASVSRRSTRYGGGGLVYLARTRLVGDYLSPDFWGESLLEPQYPSTGWYATGGMLWTGPAGLTYGVNGSFYGRINVLTLTGSIGWRWF